jgi:thiol-disulfide isomerase/thioredoxin
MTDIAIGPLSIPGPMLLLFGAIIAALAAGNQFAAGERANVERSLWLVIGLALLAARIGFVLRYRELYLGEPLRILDVRDGGFAPVAGFAAGIAISAWIAWRRAALRKPLLVVLTVGCAVWVGGSAALSVPGRPQLLPDITLTALDGSAVRLASLRGKPMVVNLWASWCPPCRREMPMLAKAQSQAHETEFVFANQGEQAAAVAAYLSANGLPLHNVLLDSTGVLAQATGARGLPTTLFFNASGKLVERRTGELSAATLAQRLDILRQAPPVANR